MWIFCFKNVFNESISLKTHTQLTIGRSNKMLSSSFSPTQAIQKFSTSPVFRGGIGVCGSGCGIAENIR